MVDILIPVGGRPESANDELRIALRSIAKYTDVNRVFIITSSNIKWLRNVNIVKCGDPHTDNKDKNLIFKIVTALKQNPDIDDFVFWSDDQVITKPAKLAEIPRVYNDRGLDYFSKIEKKSKWQRRVENTLAVLNLLRQDVSCNWEAHTPELFNSKQILDKIGHIDWESSAGNYTICTLFAYLCGYKKSESTEQSKVKYTYESENPKVKFDKLYIGYNDTGFNTGLKEALFEHFNEPCRYEVEGCNDPANGILVTNITSSNVHNLTEQIQPNDILFALDTSSYEAIKGLKNPSCYVLCTDKVTLATVKCAVNMAKNVTNRCVIIDGKYKYKPNYISSNTQTLDKDIALCITDTLNSFSTMIFNPTVVSACLDTIDTITNLNNLGAFLIDHGVRPVVIVNNAT